MDINQLAVSPDMNRAALLMRKGAVGLCAFYLLLRPLSPGLDVSEPESAFLAGISFLAALLCGMSLLARQEWPHPEWGFWGPLSVFVLCAAAAVQAAGGGNYQLAADLGNLWLSDLFLVLALSGTVQQPGAFRLYISCFAAGVASAAAYGVYQRFFGLEYMRRIFSVANGYNLNENFNIRLQSDRVSGPFSYANALAAVCLLALPLLSGLSRLRSETKRLAGGGAFVLRHAVLAALLLTVLALAYSGSKAGIAVAVLFQFFCVIWEMPQRTLRTVLSAGGWLALLAGVSCSVAYAVSLAVGGDSGLTAGLTVFALLWFVLLLRLPGWLQRLPHWPGLLTVVAGGVAGIAGVVVVASSPADSAVGRARSEAIRQADVRLNYWRAGIRMVQDHPARGVGLDNFGENYPAYKLPEGWEVKRAHNHYLQLAADGGLPLLFSFLLFIGFFFRPRRPADSALAAKDVFSPDFYRNCGVLAAICAFLLTYIFYLMESFSGLGMDFFLSELSAAPGSIRQQTGSYWGVFVHGGAHLLVFPAVSILVLLGVFQLLGAGGGRRLRGWLLLGVGAVLVHVLFDFVLYHAVVAGLFWAVCALGRKQSAPDASGTTMVRLPLLPARLAMLLLLTGGLLLFMLDLKPRLEGSTASTIVQKLMLGLTGPDELQRALQKADAALLCRPQDAELHRMRAQLLETVLQQGLVLDAAQRENLRKEALQEYVLATDCAPRSSALRRARAQQVLKLNSNSPESRRQAVELLRQAVERYPTKAEYRLALAFALAHAGDPAAARIEAVEAIKYHELASDGPMRLSPNQLMRARQLANRSEN